MHRPIYWLGKVMMRLSAFLYISLLPVDDFGEWMMMDGLNYLLRYFGYIFSTPMNIYSTMPRDM